MSKKVCTKDIQTIQHGSQLLKKCAESLNLKNKEFRDQLFSETLCTDNLTQEQKQLLDDAIPAIDAVKQVEGRVIRNLEGLIYKFASFAYRKVNSPMVDLDDFRQDARFAVSEAIFGYSNDDKSKFITYVSKCIQNRLTKSINACNPMCPLTNEALALLRLVEETRVSINRSVSLEEILDILELTEEQKSVVMDATVTVNEENYLNHQQMRYNDYTEHRRGIDKESNTVPCNYELHEAIDKANLTKIERHAVEAYMEDYYGWREDVASQHINPETGKRYTREGIRFILKRAFEKIQRAYSRG